MRLWERKSLKLRNCSALSLANWACVLRLCVDLCNVVVRPWLADSTLLFQIGQSATA